MGVGLPKPDIRIRKQSPAIKQAASRNHPEKYQAIKQTASHNHPEKHQAIKQSVSHNLPEKNIRATTSSKTGSGSDIFL